MSAIMEYESFAFLFRSLIRALSESSCSSRDGTAMPLIVRRCGRATASISKLIPQPSQEKLIAKFLAIQACHLRDYSICAWQMTSPNTHSITGILYQPNLFAAGGHGRYGILTLHANQSNEMVLGICSMRSSYS